MLKYGDLQCTGYAAVFMDRRNACKYFCGITFWKKFPCMTEDASGWRKCLKIQPIDGL
jgi:hypothetical protein